MENNSSEEIAEHHNYSNNEVALYLGNKCLTLSLPKSGELELLTSIVNIPDDKPRIPGATSELYSRAREIMQDTVNRLNISVTYTFMTDNTKMISWARVYGYHIFNWNVCYDGDDEYVSERVFNPEK